MPQARFYVDAELRPFLPRDLRVPDFEASFPTGASLKNVLEGLGIPHTEIALVRIDGRPAALDAPAVDGTTVQVLAWSPPERSPPAGALRFVADAHLGGLARHLRMLGFDTVHDGCIADEAIRALARDAGRIVLTRDRELLKCREIACGCYVRSTEPTAQLREVDRRFGLGAHLRPFTRCLRCNGELVAADKAQVLHDLPPAVARNQQVFSRCTVCARTYWPGSHHEGMLATIRRLFG